MAVRVKIHDVEDFQRQVEEMLAALDATGARSPQEAAPSDVALISQAARVALRAAAAGMGECREETPYASLYPLIEGGSFKWCCTHDTPHCSS